MATKKLAVEVTKAEAEAIRKLIIFGSASASITGDLKLSRWAEVGGKAYERWKAAHQGVIK